MSIRLHFKLTMSVAAFMPSRPSDMANDTSTNPVHFRSLTPSQMYRTVPNYYFICWSSFGLSLKPRSAYIFSLGILTSSAVLKHCYLESVDVITTLYFLFSCLMTSTASYLVLSLITKSITCFLFSYKW